MRLSLRMLAALLPLTLAGCIFHADYPKQWSAPLKTVGCAGLAGDFAQDGTAQTVDGARGSKFFYLLLKDREDFAAIERGPKIDHVVLSFSGGVLTAQAMHGTQPVRSLRLSEADGDLHCRRSGAEITLYSGVTHGAGNPVAGVEYDSLALAVTEDGYLVVKRSGGATGLVYMVWPIYVSQTDWMRFAPWKPSAGK